MSVQVEQMPHGNFPHHARRAHVQLLYIPAHLPLPFNAMNLSPTASSVSTSTTSLSTSSTSNSTLHPGSVLSTSLRRRSVDTGGLNLVVNDTTGSGSGRGYGGWVEQDGENPAATGVAELVIAWREETTTMIAQAHPGKHPTSPSIPPTDPRRAKYIEELSEWGFDCTNLSMDDVLFCSIMLFELLFSIEGMERDIGLSLGELEHLCFIDLF